MRLPELAEAVAFDRPIFIAEGEKDVEALMAIGVTATCNPGGAGKWRDEFSQHLVGADVLILPDNDEPGQQHAAQVAEFFFLALLRARVCFAFPIYRPKAIRKRNRIAAGGRAEELWQLVESI